MNAIVLNTLTTAVTEHDLGTMHAITPSYLGDDAGLYTVGGDTDNGVDIDAVAETGCVDWGSSLMKHLECAFLATVGAGSCFLNVRTKSGAMYSYSFTLASNGESQAKVGRGLRENRFAFGVANIGGVFFRLDGLEVLIAQSATRRT